MPELFPSVASFVLCALVLVGAQLIYATVGFGSGMFSVALLALILPDLTGAVGTLLLLTCVTEAWVLIHAWRQAKARLLLGLLPTTAVGMWLGTELLVSGDVGLLKRGLGLVVLAAGMWFLYQERRRVVELDGGLRRRMRDGTGTEDGASGAQARRTGDEPSAATPTDATARRPLWVCLPVGLASGVLAGLFGTGGPPVIVFLKSYRLDKGAFRATLLWFFLLMSGLRGTSYVQHGVLTWSEVSAALWLLPASLLGTVAGMVVHHKLSERHFAGIVSVLLMLLGALLLIGGGK